MAGCEDRRSDVRRDLRATRTWSEVSEFFRRLHEPGFGQPTDLFDVDVRPGSREVVATALVRDSAEGKGRLAVVTARDGRLVPVAAGPADSFWPRWSADGEYLAFLSGRGRHGTTQLQVLARTRAGEAEQISVAGTVEQMAWSPRGHQVLLRVAEVSEDKHGPREHGGRRTVDKAPDWMPHVEGGRGFADGRALWLADIDQRAARRVTGDELTVWEAAWAGPGRAVAVTSADKTESGWYGAVLSLIDTGTGTCETVLASEVQLGLPAGAPDGQHIAVVEAACSDRGVTVGDLLLLRDGGGRQRIDTGGVDVSSLRWLDSRRLSFAGLRGLDNVVGMVDVATGERTELWCSREALGGVVLPDALVLPEGAVVASRQGYRLPPGIAIHEHGVTTEIASTVHGGTADIARDIGTCERVSWTAADGWQIDGLLARPPAPGPQPLVVVVHGGPVGAWRERWLLTQTWVPLLVSRGYAVLAPNPRGSVGRGQRFARAVLGDMGGADARDILTGIDSLAVAGLADPARVGVMGESYGGFMTDWLITQDQRFKAAVPMHTVTHWRSQHYTSVIPAFDEIFLDRQPLTLGQAYDQRSPLMHADRVSTPALHIAGALDPYTHPAESLQFHRALARRGVESVFAVYPTEAHGIHSYQAALDLCTRVIDWFEAHMAPDSGRRPGPEHLDRVHERAERLDHDPDGVAGGERERRAGHDAGTREQHRPGGEAQR
jgi:dipeptidyl aminopeptidase/acylaminoacyl peptidase